MNSTLDNRRLKNLYSSNENFKFAFDYFAGRQYNSKKTSADRLLSALKKEGHEISRGEIIDLFRALETSLCGKFFVGRKGHPTRFEWSVGLVDVGQAAAGEEIEVRPLTESDREVDAGDDDDAEQLIEHRFMLRPSLEVKLMLPSDLSKTEATRLSDFVKTASFEV